MKELIEACKAAMPDASVQRHVGPVPRKWWQHYQEERSSYEERVLGTKVRRGYSLIDGTIRIKYKAVDIWLHQDTYSVRSDGTPVPREERQFAKLISNERGRDSITVRLPKPGPGEEIDIDALKFATSEICQRLREAIDEGKLGDKNDPKQLVEFLKDLRRKNRPGEKSKAEPRADQP
jgi:hypothetical protein